MDDAATPIGKRLIGLPVLYLPANDLLVGSLLANGLPAQWITGRVY